MTNSNGAEVESIPFFWQEKRKELKERVVVHYRSTLGGGDKTCACAAFFQVDYLIFRIFEAKEKMFHGQPMQVQSQCGTAQQDGR